MRTSSTGLASLVLVLAVLGGCGTQEPTETDVHLGQLDDFALEDSDGRAFKLSALDANRADIEAVLRALGADVGLTADMGTDTELSSLEGLQEDGELDTWAKWQFLYKAGAGFGRVANEEDLDAIVTLKDAIDWIERLNGTPVVFMTWAARCKTCPQMNDRILETLGKVDARVFAVASSGVETPEMYEKYRDMFDFHMRILPDADQRITDALGADRTPTFAVIDGQGRLRYRGALDDDPMGVKELDERIGYLTDAIAAVATGAEVPTPESQAAG